MHRTSTTVVITLTRRGVLDHKMETRHSRIAATPRGLEIVAIAASAEPIHKIM